jgi:hypothetical protein
LEEIAMPLTAHVLPSRSVPRRGAAPQAIAAIRRAADTLLARGRWAGAAALEERALRLEHEMALAQEQRLADRP